MIGGRKSFLAGLDAGCLTFDDNPLIHHHSDLAFVRRGQPGVAIYSVEDGKFICPPGGSFATFLSDPETPEVLASGKILYQWWEEKP